GPAVRRESEQGTTGFDHSSSCGLASCLSIALRPRTRLHPMLFSTISDLKDVLEATTHLSRDALHVHIGLVIFIVAAAFLRSERRFLIAFVALLALCLIGEMADFQYAAQRNFAFNWLASAKDVVNTMFWPAIGLVAGPQILRLLRLSRQGQAVGRRPVPSHS